MKNLAIVVFLFLSGVCFASTTGTRILPPTYIPGGYLSVTLNVNVDSGVTGVIVREHIPDDFTMVDTALQSTYWVIAGTEVDDNGRIIHKWIAFGGVGVPSFSMTYRVYIPPTASGDYEFSGSVMTFDNPGGAQITGDTILRGGKGDINGDGTVDISDVIICLRIAIGLSQWDQRADMNNDDIVDISDVILALRVSIGLL